MSSRNIFNKQKNDPRYKGGISIELILPQFIDITKNLICRKCSDLAYDPILCIYCEAIYCRVCSKNLNKKNTCVTCRKEFIQKNIQKQLFNILSQTDLRCLYNQNGCRKIVKYNSFFDHVHNCKYTLFRTLSPGVNHNLSRSYLKKFMGSIKLVNKQLDGENKDKNQEIECANCRGLILLNQFSSHNNGKCLLILNSLYENLNNKLETLNSERQRLSDLVIKHQENQNTVPLQMPNVSNSIASNLQELIKKYPSIFRISENNLRDCSFTLALDFYEIDYNIIKDIIEKIDVFKALHSLIVICGNNKIDLCKFFFEQINWEETSIEDLVIELSFDVPSNLCSEIISFIKKMSTSLQTLKIKANLEINISEEIRQSFISLEKLRYLKLNLIPNFSKFVPVLKNMKTLQALNLEENNLNENDSRLLAGALSNINCLESLNLRGNKLDTGLIHLINVLNKFKNLKYLNLSSTGLGTNLEAISELGKKFSTLPDLSFLILDSSSLGNNGISTLSNYFKSLKKLLVLSIRGNDISTEAIKLFAKNLVHLIHLRDFDISYNPGISSEGVKDILINLSSLKNLKKLKLMNLNLNLDCMLILTSDFQLFKNIESLNLANVDLLKDTNMVKQLSSGLTNLISLKKLNLNNSNLGDEEILMLSSSFSNLPQLIKLDISKNKFSLEGIINFSGSLENLKNIRILIMNNNKLGTEGIKKLISNIKYLDMVEEIDLSENDIDHNGCLLIAFFCRELKRIRLVNLRGNNINKEDIGIFKETKNYKILI